MSSEGKQWGKVSMIFIEIVRSKNGRLWTTVRSMPSSWARRIFDDSLSSKGVDYILSKKNKIKKNIYTYI